MIEFGNLRRVDGTTIFIQISGGLISGITKQPRTTHWLDFNGWTVIPAGIDGHVHFRDEEQKHKEDWNTGTLAALRGGYSLVADMPNKQRPIVTYERLLELEEFIGERPIDYRLWFGATTNNLGEIAQAIRHPKTLGVKVYRGSSTGNLLVEDDKAFWKIGELVCQAQSLNPNVYVAVHNEDEALMRLRLQRLGRAPQISDHCQIRDTEVEVSSVKKTIQMQIETGCAVYYCHISTPESLHLLHSARQAGVRMVVEVCTHHACISDRGNDPFGKVNPPLRTPQQMQRVAELLERNDFVDVIGSDHAPHTEEEKLVGEYGKTPSGLTGVQTTIPLLLNKVAEGTLSWKRFLDLTSGNYATSMGLNRGQITEGFEAELTFVDPNEQWTINNSSIVSKCGWTPYDGTKVRGAVKGVFTKGQLHKF